MRVRERQRKILRQRGDENRKREERDDEKRKREGKWSVGENGYSGEEGGQGIKKERGKSKVE